MLFTFWKPCVMFPANFLTLFPKLFLMWKCHMWYLLTLFPHLSFMWRCHMWYLLTLFPHLSFMWRCHLWYLCSLYSCMYHYWQCPYHCWHCRWFHSTLHHFYALTSMLSCSLFALKPEAPFSSTLFFLLKTLLRESATSFFLFSSVVYISSLVLLTLVGGFCGFSF
jgi:hypothetical protein